MRIAFMGTPDFAVPTLDALAAAGHEIVAVYTQPARPAGRGKALQPSPVQQRAEALGLAVRSPVSLRDPDAQQAFAALGLDVAVVAAYGLILPLPILEAPRLGCLNVHGSLLPRWRGAAPVERAIMAGDLETGVTIHETVKELDAGPIAAQRAFPIGSEDDAGAVFARAAELAAELLHDVLPSPAFTPQPEQGATYADKITAADREIVWERPQEEIVNRIRALSPHIGARAELEGRRVIVWRARLAGDTIELLEVQPEGRRRMSYDEFRRGRR
jgi:methionyl-tRNA formyltransferase